jgi:hypothetical protein
MILHNVLQLRVNVNVAPSSLIISTLIMEAIYSSETSVHTRVMGRYNPEDGILHRHRRENLKSYIELTDCTLYRRRNVSTVKYELGLYILEDGIPHSHCHENLKYYIALTGWTL